MKFTILAIGHKMPAWIEQGVLEYTKRLPREAQMVFIELKPDKRSHRTAEQVMETERDRILSALPLHNKIIALDERGQVWRTVELAQQMGLWQREGQDIAFIIGGADGLHPDIKAQAHQLLQLSALTLPHGLVRIVLAEQLYRAWSINQNHPYHRE